MRLQASLLQVIKKGKWPYLLLALSLAFCCLVLLWPSLPPAPAPVSRPVLPPLTYLAISRDRGIVLVIPLAGPELKIPLDTVQEQPLSPHSLDEPESALTEEISEEGQWDSMEDSGEPWLENAEPGRDYEAEGIPEQE